MKIQNENWEQFVLALIFHLMIPLLPIILVIGHRFAIDEREYHLFTSLFAFHIGVSSKNKIALILNCTSGGLMIVMLNSYAKGSFDGFFSLFENWRFTIIIVLTYYHVYERVIKHLLNNDKYFDNH